MRTFFLSRFGHCRGLLTGLAMLLAPLSAAAEIHLSPAGNDANSGSLAERVATPQRARDLVRGLITGGLSEPVEVVIAAGNYVMDSPLELRPEDSGTAAFPITWKAAPGAFVILSGGRPITST